MKRMTGNRSARGLMTGRTWRRFRSVPLPAVLWSVLFSCVPAAAPAIQILEAVDHAELEAEISNRAVSRIALVGDRIARVIRGPDGFVVEHDAARGDVYLRPVDVSGVRLSGDVRTEPLTLFIGTAAGFTYRLALTVADRGSAQILIRNAAAAGEPGLVKPGDGHVGALVALVRAAARRELPPGYEMEAVAGKRDVQGLAVLEIWRGPRFTVHVLEAGSDPGNDASALASRFGPDTAAIWAGPPGSGRSGGRLVVAVADGAGTGLAEGTQ